MTILSIANIHFASLATAGKERAFRNTNDVAAGKTAAERK
jgi:hypothetical protein